MDTEYDTPRTMDVRRESTSDLFSTPDAVQSGDMGMSFNRVDHCIDLKEQENNPSSQHSPYKADQPTPVDNGLTYFTSEPDLTKETIYYRPIGERKRREIIRDVFQMNPSSLVRTNYAFGFGPLSRTDKQQVFKKQKMPMDGNCYYSSLAQIFFGDISKHDVVRLLIQTYFNANRDSPDLPDKTNDIKDLFTVNGWATEYIHQIRIEMLDVPQFTYIRRPYLTAWLNMVQNTTNPSESPHDWTIAIYLDLINDNHYEPVHQGIHLHGDIQVAGFNGKSLKEPVWVPSLTPGKTVFADGELTRNILTLALVNMGLTYPGINTKLSPHRDINATNATFQSGAQGAVKQQLINLFDKFVEPNDRSFRISTYRLC